ncbi:class I SAM-dependent methyltransferase [Desulfovibrio inopinatus]|uniref:class I SAM-dependent methyltransferase n=1 Tax=Desulfovibrio inopinatus TaxID=102109 RepID=UPI00048245B5|nr:class I SAM-dependent methyltransferase [Desulfovibrio inopinatus]
MADVSEHYKSVLAAHYSWMMGGLEMGIRHNEAFFRQHGLTGPVGSRAVDLGCGSGFQALALACLGYNVIGVDTSETLLEEMQAHARHLTVTAKQHDLTRFREVCPDPASLIVCMGDTLTHLPTLESVDTLFADIMKTLEPHGRMVLTFRNQKEPLTGLDRIIPVRSDASTLFTCFLEYEAERIRVTDVIYTREDQAWAIHKGFYYKLRLDLDLVTDKATSAGFEITEKSVTNGLVCIIATKPSR